MEYTGEDPKKIVFSMPIRQESEISFAASLNVLASVFDNEDELYKIKKLDPRARLLIRFRCDAKKASVIFGRKFGAEPESVPRLLRVARSLDLEIVGLAFHVGSDCHEPDAFKRAILIGRQLMDLAAKEFGYNMTLLDIGGGFSGDPDNLNCLAFVINSALEKHFPVNCGVNIIAEPGRYYVTSAFTLATRIFGRRLLTDEVSIFFIRIIRIVIQRIWDFVHI